MAITPDQITLPILEMQGASGGYFALACLEGSTSACVIIAVFFAGFIVAVLVAIWHIRRRGGGKDGDDD